MIFRSILAFLAAACLAGCAGLEQKDKSKPAGKKKKTAAQNMPDQSSDVAFQSFVGRLRTAVQMRDLATLASMMTPNFGYGINPDREGEGVFQFWDENDTWKELELVLLEKFVPHEQFMVAPPEFAKDPDTFIGYRAGIRQVNGSWKFAYFVGGGGSAPDAKPKP